MMVALGEGVLLGSVADEIKSLNFSATVRPDLKFR